MDREDWSSQFLTKYMDPTQLQIEFRKYIKPFYIIQYICKELKEKYQLLDNHVMRGAYTFFHKFSIVNNFLEKEQDFLPLYLACGSCILISCKALNFLIPYNSVSQITVKRLNSKNENYNLKISNVKELLINYEFDVLKSLGFNADLNLNTHFKPILEEEFKKIHPYLNCRFYEKFFNLIKEDINNTFILPICVYYDINIIILSSLKNTFQKAKIEFDFDLFIEKYYSFINKDLLKECTNLVCKIKEFWINNNKCSVDNQNNKNADFSNKNLISTNNSTPIERLQ